MKIEEILKEGWERVGEMADYLIFSKGEKKLLYDLKKEKVVTRDLELPKKKYYQVVNENIQIR